MSLPEAAGRFRLPAVRSTRSRAAALVLTVCAASLGACTDGSGFKPLYGATGGETYDQRLAKVDIAPISGRVGQRIRNELVFQRSTGQSASGQSASSQSASTSELRLDVIITETLLTTLVNSTGASSSQVYQLEARYQLVDTRTKKAVLDGRSLGRGSFDRFASIYSNVRGREDAENRVAKSIADDIRTRLLAYLSRPA